MIKKRPSKKPAPDDWDDEIIFYCKDCEKVVDARRFGRKYVYKCKECGTKNVAFGTQRSIENFFHIEEDEPKKGAGTRD